MQLKDEGDTNNTEGAKKFQFQEVQLKGLSEKWNNVGSMLFQFQEVQLKGRQPIMGGHKINDFNSKRCS